MIPKPDSVKIFNSYISLYDGLTYDLRTYRNFALGATYANWFPKHTFGLELSLPYQGQAYESFSNRAQILQSSLKYVSKNYINKKYRTFKIQATWKYFLKSKSTPYYFYAYKNAPTPNDSVPIIEGERQERYYLRGGLNYFVSPSLVRMVFYDEPNVPFSTADNGFLLHRNRALTLFLGFEKQKEHYTSTSIDRIRFYDYHKTKKFYGDLLFQPFGMLGKLEVIDSLAVASDDPSIVASSQAMDKSMRDYIKDNIIKVNTFGIRVGYSFDHIFNSPVGIAFETGVMTGVDRRGAILGSFYSKMRLNIDINLTKPLRTEGIAW
ncbi:MAG: hypothetical protein KJ941_11970 [Bacteroidetes bacterium]|nr:hypothetical protein [Bacteroidota bacterium]